MLVAPVIAGGPRMDFHAATAHGIHESTKGWSVSNCRNKQTDKIGAKAPASLFRVLVADRDPMSSDLLAAALSREGQFQASPVLAANLLQVLATHPVDLVVLGSDATVNLQDGSELTAALIRTHPNLLIVMLLSVSERASVINAFRIGARGVFCRDQPMADFLDCIKHVRRGFIWAGGREAGYLLDAIKNIPGPIVAPIHAPTLTDRELQVVQQAATGKTNRCIARELRLSEHTVKNYLFRAFEKLGVSSRVELLFYLAMAGHTWEDAASGSAVRILPKSATRD